MSRSSVLILVGFLTMLVSFIGLPLEWVRIASPLLGFAVVVIGFLMRSDRISILKSHLSPPPKEPPPNDLSPIA